MIPNLCNSCLAVNYAIMISSFSHGLLLLLLLIIIIIIIIILEHLLLCFDILVSAHIVLCGLKSSELSGKAAVNKALSYSVKRLRI